MMQVRKALLVAVAMCGLVTLGACSSSSSSSSSDDGTPSTTDPNSLVPTTGTAPSVTIDTSKKYNATLDTSAGKIVIALDAKSYPKSVNQFVTLANERFYDGLTFHRVARDFVIQGGDPNGNGTGGPGYGSVVETPANGYQVGSVAWAKTGSDPNGAAGSQFFIVTSDGINLQQALNTPPYKYGIIGTVTEGLDVAKRIEGFAPSTGDGAPTSKVTIKKVIITETPA